MNLLALGLVVLSAFAHAGWNYLGKASGDKHSFFWCFIALGSLLYLPVAGYFAFRTTFTPAAGMYLAGTAVFHIIYFQLLKVTYTHCDLSVSYPVSRGVGLALIAVMGIVLLEEDVSLEARGAIGIIILGIIVAHVRTGSKTPFWSKTMLLPIAVGLSIAAYSLWDKKAMSDAKIPPLVLGQASFMGQAIVNGLFVFGRREELRNEIRQRWKSILLAAILAPASYLLFLFALTLPDSQVSYVAPARELGIVVGVFMGRFLLKETTSLPRILGSILIVAGALALALVP